MKIVKEGIKMSESKKDNLKVLSDEVLEKVSGGGNYRPVSGCPNGYTKFVTWLLQDYSGGPGCNSCQYYYQDRIGKNKNTLVKSCRMISGDYAWE